MAIDSLIVCYPQTDASETKRLNNFGGDVALTKDVVLIDVAIFIFILISCA